MEVDPHLPLSDHSPVEEVHLPDRSGDSVFIQSKSVGAHKHTSTQSRGQSELKRRSAQRQCMLVDTEARGRGPTCVRKQAKQFEGDTAVRSRLTAADSAC